MSHAFPAFAVLSVVLSLAAPPARAEPVRLPIGADRFGQGWMFSDRNGACRIVTAAHVIARGDGLFAPVAIDRHGRELVTAAPVQPDRSVDVAFLEARPSRPCPPDGLAEADADKRLSASPQAFLEFLGLKAGGTVALTRRARSLDDDGGRIVVFERGSSAVSISQGMSGGVVTDGAGKPLAVLSHTDPEENRARAVRIDVAAALLRTAARPSSAQRSAIIGWSARHGRSLDPARGPDQMVAGRGGWLVEADRGYVVVDMALAAPQRLGALSFRVDDAARGQVTGVQIFGAATSNQVPAEWPAIASCVPAPGVTQIVCDFAARTLAAMRVQIKLNVATVTIEGFAVAER